MDAAFVREGVCPDNRLAGGDAHSRYRGEKMRGAGDLLSPNPRGQPAVGVAAGAKPHHDLLHRGVAGALADAADRAFHLPRACADARERVCDGEPEVVVAVGRYGDVCYSPDAVHDGGDECAELVRRRVSHGVGYVHDGCAGRDGRLESLAQEVDVRARCVLRRELHIAAKVAGVCDGVPYAFQALGAGNAKLVLEVDVARGEEGVDARTRRAADCRRRSVDVLLQRS